MGLFFKRLFRKNRKKFNIIKKMMNRLIIFCLIAIITILIIYIKIKKDKYLKIEIEYNQQKKIIEEFLIMLTNNPRAFVKNKIRNSYSFSISKGFNYRARQQGKKVELSGTLAFKTSEGYITIEDLEKINNKVENRKITFINTLLKNNIIKE